VRLGPDIGLPGLQSPFALSVLAAAALAKVPVVLVLVHNLPVSFDELVQASADPMLPVRFIHIISFDFLIPLCL
jgi:hypothetical protein